MSSKRTIEKQRVVLGRLLALVVLLVLGCGLLLTGNPDWLPGRIGYSPVPAQGTLERSAEEPPPVAKQSPADPTSGETDISGKGDTDGETVTETTLTESIPLDITVHLTGSVNRPGLVKVADGSTLADAVDAAGGFLPDAAVDYVNLAARVEANSLLRIPSLSEVGDSEPPSYLPGAALQADPGNPESGSEQIEAGGKVNINTADQALLETLPGIGPSLAAAIVGERESGGDFASIEDLMRVPGIKEGKLAQLYAFVTTG